MGVVAGNPAGPSGSKPVGVIQGLNTPVQSDRGTVGVPVEENPCACPYAAADPSTGGQGSPGPAGATGPAGAPQGVTGLQGQTGVQGVAGQTGQTGVRGVTGLGTTGPQGPAGATGGSSSSDSFTISQIVGARFNWLSASTVSIGTGGEKTVVRDKNDTFNISVIGEVGPINIAASGANGLDIGVEAANTWYAVFLIADSTGSNPVAGLLSLSSSAPTLPAGYDKFRRVAWVRNNSSGDFWKMNQRGDGIDRTYNYDVERSELLALSGGNAGSFTAVPLDTWMPPTSRFVLLRLGFDTANAADLLNIRPTGSSVTDPVVFVQAGLVTASSRDYVTFAEMVLPSPSLDYQVIQGGGGNPTSDIYVQGFRDTLRALAGP